MKKGLMLVLLFIFSFASNAGDIVEWIRLDIESVVTDQDKIDDLTKSNQIPNLERNDELLGVDDDNNGIRVRAMNPRGDIVSV